MARLMEIRLERRNVACVARLLDEDAPLTCDIVWNALPLGGDVWHAKFAMNEIYCLVPPIQGDAIANVDRREAITGARRCQYTYKDAQDSVPWRCKRTRREDGRPRAGGDRLLRRALRHHGARAGAHARGKLVIMDLPQEDALGIIETQIVGAIQIDQRLPLVIKDDRVGIIDEE